MKSGRDWLIALLVAMMLTAINACAVDPIDSRDARFPDPAFDRHKYAFMATHGELAAHPFGKRVVVPFLASRFPDSETGFRVLSVVFVLGSSLLVFLLALQLGASASVGWFCQACFFTISTVVRGGLEDFWLVDLGCQAMVLAVLCLSLTRSWWLALPVMLAAMFAKEAALVSIPLVWAAAALLGWPAVRRWTVVGSLALVGAAAFFGAGRLFPDRTAEPGYLASLPAGVFPQSMVERKREPGAHPSSLADSMRQTLSNRIHDLRPRSAYDYLVQPFGPFLLCASIWALAGLGRRAWALVPFGLLVVAQLALGSDTARLLAYGYSGALLAVAFALRSRGAGPRDLWFAGSAAIFAALPVPAVASLGIQGLLSLVWIGSKFRERSVAAS